MSTRVATLHWFVTELDPKNAGYRVRTLPIVAELRRQGVAVELHAIPQLPGKCKQLADGDNVVVVSKPADAMTLLCLWHLRDHGVPVVVDLFDNYFSWSPALHRRQLHWQWMCALQSASLAIVSSDFLARVVASLVDKPVVEVGDLVVPARAGRLDPSALRAKWSEQAVVEVLWFGIGANPFYSSGLEDIVRWAGVVHDIARAASGRTRLRLTLCTNNVPGVEGALQAMREEQVEARYVEWSEAVCDELLSTSHVVLLPTNLTGFSLSKTHNRCGDALASGCLVLASPNGPYRGLGGAVFDDPRALASTLGRITPEAVRQAIDETFGVLRGRHDLASDIERLQKALAALPSAPTREAKPRGGPPILIASRVRVEVPKYSRTLGYLVAGFANGPSALNFDFRLEDLAAFDGCAALTLSDRGRQAIDGVLLRDVDADVDDFGSHSVCRVRGWQLRLERSPHRIIVERGLPAESLQALARAQSLPLRGSDFARSSWFDAHVDALARILIGIGLSRLRLAAEDEGGWQAFADVADPELAGIAGRLSDHWRRMAGRESAWGRPEVQAA